MFAIDAQFRTHLDGVGAPAPGDVVGDRNVVGDCAGGAARTKVLIAGDLDRGKSERLRVDASRKGGREASGSEVKAAR